MPHKVFLKISPFSPLFFLRSIFFDFVQLKFRIQLQLKSVSLDFFGGEKGEPGEVSRFASTKFKPRPKRETERQVQGPVLGSERLSKYQRSLSCL